jgi:hypothetical protein
MAKLKYTSDEESHREAKHIEFTISEDLNINEFKIICKRLAAAMGYHPESIKKEFGNDWDGDKKADLEQFVNIMNACLTGSKEYI